MDYEDFKLHDGDYVLLRNNQPVEKLDIIYHHTSVIELMNTKEFQLDEGIKFVEMTKLPVELQIKYRLALYQNEYGQNQSYKIALNNLLKDRIEKDFITIISRIGMTVPENLEDIIQSIFEYILDLPKRVYGDEDILFGFQNWIESK